MPEELGDLFIEHIAAGKYATDFCAEHGLARSTPWRWEQKDPEFKKRVAHAREVGRRVMQDEMLAEASRARPGTQTTIEENDDGEVKTKKVIADNVPRSKLIIETIGKYLAITDPANYAERKQIDATVAHSFAELVMQAEQLDSETKPEDGADEDLFA